MADLTEIGSVFQEIGEGAIGKPDPARVAAGWTSSLLRHNAFFIEFVDDVEGI